MDTDDYHLQVCYLEMSLTHDPVYCPNQYDLVQIGTYDIQKYGTRIAHKVKMRYILLMTIIASYGKNLLVREQCYACAHNHQYSRVVNRSD